MIQQQPNSSLCQPPAVPRSTRSPSGRDFPSSAPAGPRQSWSHSTCPKTCQWHRLRSPASRQGHHWSTRSCRPDSRSRRQCLASSVNSATLLCSIEFSKGPQPKKLTKKNSSSHQRKREGTRHQNSEWAACDQCTTGLHPPLFWCWNRPCTDTPLSLSPCPTPIKTLFFLPGFQLKRTATCHPRLRQPANSLRICTQSRGFLALSCTRARRKQSSMPLPLRLRSSRVCITFCTLLISSASSISSPLHMGGGG